MQTARAASSASPASSCRTSAADGVVYGEIRWAPEQHLARRAHASTRPSRPCRRGIEQGDRRARTREGHVIRVGQLVTAMRHADRGLEIAELAVRHRDRGVVGFDIAGRRGGLPASNHRRGLRLPGRASSCPSTVHAGEADGLDSIRSALLDGRALRLGHGVRLAEDIAIEREDDDNTYVDARPARPVGPRPRDRARALAVVEPADRRHRGVGRRARRPPVRPALPARLPGHGQHRQPPDERHQLSRSSRCSPTRSTTTSTTSRSSSSTRPRRRSCRSRTARSWPTASRQASRRPDPLALPLPARRGGRHRRRRRPTGVRPVDVRGGRRASVRLRAPTPDGYADAMIRVIEEFGPYVVIAPGLALAHARPGDDVLRTASRSSPSPSRCPSATRTTTP